MYEVTQHSPTDGVEKYNEEQLAGLEQDLHELLPDYPEDVDFVNGSDDGFEALKAWIVQLDSGEDDSVLNATSGSEVRFFFGLLSNRQLISFFFLFLS